MKTLLATALPAFADRLGTARSAGRHSGPSLMTRIATWHRVWRERNRLLELDDRMLADLGLTREDATREASRPFWDVHPGAYR